MENRVNRVKARKPKECEEERFVREALLARFGAHVRKLPESRQEREKTADFELLVGDQRCAVMEVKRLIRTPRTPENGWTVVEHITGIRKATRDDNSPRRVATIIHTAWSQLCNYQEAKILTIVNDERLADAQDLSEAFNGFLEYRNDQGFGYRNVASAGLANGRIRELKWKIDLYIWIDRHCRAEPTLGVITDAGYQIARLCFGCPDLGAPANNAWQRADSRGCSAQDTLAEVLRTAGQSLITLPGPLQAGVSSPS